MGAWAWTDEQRNFAEDPINLLAVSGPALCGGSPWRPFAVQPLRYPFGDTTDFRVESLTRLRSTLNGRRTPRDWWLGKWEPVTAGVATTS